MVKSFYNTFQLEVPSAWQWHESEDMLSFNRLKDAVGGVNVTCYKREEMSIEDDESIESLTSNFISETIEDQKSDEIKREYTKIDNTSASIFRYRQHGLYWLFVHILNQDNLVAFSYNCKAEKADIETDDILKLVKSFKWI